VIPSLKDEAASELGLLGRLSHILLVHPTTI